MKFDVYYHDMGDDNECPFDVIETFDTLDECVRFITAECAHMSTLPCFASVPDVPRDHENGFLIEPVLPEHFNGRVCTRDTLVQRRDPDNLDEFAFIVSPHFEYVIRQSVG